jgi:hypothetical protein
MNTKNKKNTFLKTTAIPFLFYLIFASFALSVIQFASPDVALSQTLEEELKGTLGEITKTTKLPGFDTLGHADSSYEPGASGITSAILFIVDLFKYLLGTIAVIVIISSGVRLITAGKKIDDIAETQKESIKYAIIGLLIIVLADTMIKQVFFGEQGEVFRSTADIQLAAERGTEQLRGVYMFLEFFIGAIAVLMIVIAGIRRVASGGNEDTITKTNKQIMWAIIGLIVIGLAEFVVKDIVFPDQGSRLPNVDNAAFIIRSLTNFASGFIATIAVAMYMYGGYLYVIGATNEENTNKAKKVIIAATIGLVLAMGAYALVNTFIKVQPLIVEQVEEVTPNLSPGLNLSN